MFRPSIYHFLAVVITLIITGCKNVPPVTSGIGSDELSSEQNFSQHLKVDNEKLSSQLTISDIKTRTRNELLEVNLQLTSHYQKSLQLQYHFNWFDKDGFAVEARKTPWQPLELHGMQTTAVKGLAPTLEAVSFNLYVREVPEKAFKF
ncbi:YcfL family protein [Litorilituus lipolyticus]|uniref:DUF1425 domain-containing protein n=1 Tax=Litorilituus lipolyticus TaxID=2491017 RepID=A0A502L1G0_9GAMM|nr:YcfL family protein [Litorilituus lipolyticus]TPH17682.1 DUF1425 domain-containing protein [Litorilituus lipolyticus]